MGPGSGPSVSTAAYWDSGYAQWQVPVPYGSEHTYHEAMCWLLETCRSIEDWGAGPAWARRWLPAEGVDYLPIDFAEHAIRPGWSHVQADLASYVSTRPDGILIRHVLEHNDGWAAILANALGSFRKRMALVTFTPLVPKTYAAAPDSPGRDWHFAVEDLTGPMGDMLVRHYGMTTKTTFGGENVFLLERRGD